VPAVVDAEPLAVLQSQFGWETVVVLAFLAWLVMIVVTW